MAVLIEKMGGRDGQVTGRSPFMQSVYLEGDHTQLGKLVTVTVKEARQNSLLVQTGKGPQQMKSEENVACLLYTSPSPRDRQKSRMPSSA